MDFASLMSAELSKTKSTKKNDGSKTYLKRSEVEAQREAAYRAEQEALEVQRIAKLEKKRKLEEQEEQQKRERDEKRRRLAEEAKRRREEQQAEEERARRKRLGLPELPEKSLNASKEGTPAPEEEEEADIPDEDLSLKLRELGEPVKLFGESHRQTLRRYRRLAGLDVGPKLSPGPIPTYLEPVPGGEMLVDGKVSKDLKERKYLYRQITSYFNMVLSEWEVTLAERPDDVKASFTGKQAYNAMVQARENMRPMFKKLEKGEIEDSVLEPMVEIIRSMQQRRYVDANDGYLRLSIGKAAWPIGVTMVGIHERSAREKLHDENNAAHIMSDETTRKYLQSIKRCLSFAQTRWPPQDQLQLMG